MLFNKFIKGILSFTIICLLSFFSHAAENNAEDYNFSTDKLTVKDASGNVIRTFTIQELQELFPQKIYETEDPWSEGKKFLYRGPRVKDVLEKLEVVTNHNLKVTAQDGYISQIKDSEIQTYDPIFALEIGCTKDDLAQNICQPNQQFKPLTLYEKGPIRLIWPQEKMTPGYVLANDIWVYHVSSLEAIQ